MTGEAALAIIAAGYIYVIVSVALGGHMLYLLRKANPGVHYPTRVNLPLFAAVWPHFWAVVGVRFVWSQIMRALGLEAAERW